MHTTRPLDLVCEGKPEIRDKLAAKLKTVAPHLTLESISGDVEAIDGLIALIEGRTPKAGPLCSIRF